MRSAREVTTTADGAAIIYDDDRVELATAIRSQDGWMTVRCSTCDEVVYRYDEDLPSNVVKALATVTSHYEITHPDDQEPTTP